MEREELDLNRVCRACKNECPDMRPLFSRDSENAKENPRIDEMLMACASVQVSCEDGLPKSICPTCVQQLKSAFSFKSLCERTDACLREHIKNMKEQRQIKTEDVLAQGLDNSQGLFGSPTFDDIIEKEKEEGSVKDETESQSEVCESKVKWDYIQLLDNNMMLLTCKTCSKVFTTLDGLKCHKRIHTGALFKCKQCDKEYTRLNHLQRHELSHGRRKIHVCKICSKTLTRFDHLKRHLVIHLKEKPFGCQTCNRGFNRAEHLANHMNRCTGERVHVCDICNKGFNREDSLEVHKTLHGEKRPVLPTLENLDNIEEHYVELDIDDNATFSDASDFEEMDDVDCMEPQIDIAEPDKLQNLTATIYAEEDSQGLLEQKAKIEEQMIFGLEDKDAEDDDDADVQETLEIAPAEDSDSTHSEYLPRKPSPKIKRGRGRPRKYPLTPVKKKARGRPSLMKVKSEPEDDDVLGEFTCPECNLVFPRMSVLEKHAQIHDGLKLHSCETCEKKFTRANHLKRHMLSHSEVKPYVCDICTKCFNRRDHLQQHKKLHARSQDYECAICKRLFYRSEFLAKHVASKHGIGEKVVGEKKYKCPVCVKGFTTEKYRDIHMKAHAGDKKFQCKTCDKAFISKSHLVEHTKFHNDNSKKFLCSECGQRFIRNDYLVIHMRRHRGEKPFKCKYCGKGFPRTTDLTVHERYHTGEKTHLCVICGRGFGRAYNLTVHMRTHTGEKPYQCTYCDAAFAQGNDLKAHIRRHTGERFQCELCSDTFLMGYLLTQHKRVVHGLNVVSNIRRLQPISKMNQNDPDDPPPITIPLPVPVVPQAILNTQIQAQLTTTAQLQE